MDKRTPAGSLRSAAARSGRAFADAVSSVHGRAVERLLATPERVTSAAEGRSLLTRQERTEAAADRLQSVMVVAVPIVRRAAKVARFTKVPWVLVGSTTLSTGLNVRTGAREVQVLGALVAHRIEEATGQPADPALVKKIAIELYLAPKRRPDLADRELRLRRLMRRWVVRGVFGRKTGRSAAKSLRAAETLDVRPLVSRWAELDPPSPDPGAGPRA